MVFQVPQQQILTEVPEELVGQRVLLRPLRPDDAEEMYQAIMESREHLAPWMPWANGYSCLDDARTYIRRSQASWILRTGLNYGIFDRETGRYLGSVGFPRLDWSHRSFEIGYWLRKDAEGKGYMSEAVRLVTRLAFDRLEANRVEIRMDRRNDRSRAVPERLGFVREGLLRRSGPGTGPDGLPADCYVYGMIREEYEQQAWSRE